MKKVLPYDKLVKSVNFVNKNLISEEILMKKKSKAALSLILSLILLFSAVVPAFALTPSRTGSKVPVILIGGDGEQLVNKDGKPIPRWSSVFDRLTEKKEDEEGNKEVYKSVANVLLPFLIDGLLTGNYDRYYENFQKEVSELFGDSLLDENGEVANGSGLAQRRLTTMENAMKYDAKSGKGYYGFYDYQFYYDWRLDPLETADKLNEYIQGVKKITGSPKVAIIGRCLGTVIATAYVAKYGTDDLYGLGLDGTVSNGAEILSEPISGKFKLDGNAINRFLIDANYVNDLNVDAFIGETVELLEKSGVLDVLTGVTKETIYYVVVKGVTSALALSTFCTWPSFWAIVKEEDYENAMDYVFGPQGSEKRKTYAGMIEKIEKYDTVVRKHLPEIMNKVNDNANLAIFAKYGLQINPIVQSRNVVGDQFASIKCSSFGATASDIYSTLSDEYVENRVSEGKGKYISPDKQIDASTCMFPDQTWFIKGADHSFWTNIEHEVLYSAITASSQLTVDDFDCTQFLVYNYETEVSSPMTEENCNTYYWKANKKSDEPDSKAGRLLSFLTMLFKWLKSLWEKIKNK